MAKEGLTTFRTRLGKTIKILEAQVARTPNIAQRKLLLLQIEELQKHVTYTPTTKLGIGTTCEDALRKAHSPRR